MRTGSPNLYRDVQFVSENDPGYCSFRSRRIAERRARAASFQEAAFSSLAVVRTVSDAIGALSVGGSVSDDSSAAVCDAPAAVLSTSSLSAEDRNPTPCRAYVGQLVEKAARRWLGIHVKLEQKRILTWREPDQTGRRTLRYQEIDAVHSADYDTVTLYEVKCTTLERMQREEGRYQLERAADTLAAHPRIRNVRQRLVYVGDSVDRLLSGCESLRVEDLDTPFGTLWIAPGEIEWAARDLGIALPENWAA